MYVSSEQADHGRAVNFSLCITHSPPDFNEFTFYHNIQMFYIILTCFESYV